MKADSSHLVPQGRPVFQEPGQAVVVAGRLAARPAVEVRPDIAENFRVEIFGALHGRNVQEHRGQFRNTRRRHFRGLHVRNFRRVAEIRQVTRREIPPVGERWVGRPVPPLGRQREQSLGLTACEPFGDPLLQSLIGGGIRSAAGRFVLFSSRLDGNDSPRRCDCQLDAHGISVPRSVYPYRCSRPNVPLFHHTIPVDSSALRASATVLWQRTNQEESITVYDSAAQSEMPTSTCVVHAVAICIATSERRQGVPSEGNERSC